MTDTAGTDRMMTALARHVPLTLLMDLADPSGPDSRRILAVEVGDLSWLRGLAFPVVPAAVFAAPDSRAAG